MKRKPAPSRLKGKNKRVKAKPLHDQYDKVSVACQGNEWWKLRSKHGRDKLFASPQLLLEAAEGYFRSVDSNPEYEVKPMLERGKIKMVQVPKKKPYTIMALCLYLGCASAYFRQFKRDQQGKPESKDFLSIIAVIEDTIYHQQYDGAVTGFFNANIIARALGLAEKVEADVTDNRKATADLFPSILNKPDDTTK
jgi:hypothetical protein